MLFLDNDLRDTNLFQTGQKEILFKTVEMKYFSIHVK